jgi:hypothetical protein
MESMDLTAFTADTAGLHRALAMLFDPPSSAGQP